MSVILPNLRVKMAERGWNIKDVKERTSLSRTTISNMYNFYGDGIKFDTLAELCDLFNCTPNDLLLIVPVEIYSLTVSEIKKEYESEPENGSGYITYEIKAEISYKVGLYEAKDTFVFLIEIFIIFKNEHYSSDQYEARLNFYRTNKDMSLYLTYSDNIIDKIYVDFESNINNLVQNIFSSADTPLKEYGPIEDWLDFLPSTRTI